MHQKVLLISIAALAVNMAAERCTTPTDGISPDESEGTTYCGVGSSNIFGCSRDGGCRIENQASCITFAQLQPISFSEAEQNNTPLDKIREAGDTAHDIWNVLSLLTDFKKVKRNGFRKAKKVKRGADCETNTMNSLPPGDTGPCDIAYAQAMQSCWDTYPDPPGGRVYGKRGLSARHRVRSPVFVGTAKPAVKRDANTTNDASEVFSIVDKNKDGIISFPEYMAYINYTFGGQLKTFRATLPYVKLFKEHDGDGDRLINSTEVSPPSRSVLGDIGDGLGDAITWLDSPGTFME